MKRRLFPVISVTVLITLLLGLFMNSGTASASNSAVTPPSTGAYTSGIYRNLLKEAGYTDANIQAKIDTAWNQLFYGNAQQKIYYTVGTDMAYIKDINDNDVRTEGQSYGMMISVQLNHKTEFDKIWKWTKTYMQHTDPADPRYGYFAWHDDTSGNKLAQNNAGDGEIWLVTALFMADGRWGSGSGIYNYKAEAQLILDAGRSKEATSGTTGIYDLFNPSNSLIRFVSDNSEGWGMNNWTDPSYMEPAFYDYWAKVASHDTAFWSGAASAARNFLHATANSTTGLVPNYANFDGTPHNCCVAPNNNMLYAWDARRTEMNIGMDYHWWAKDAVEITNTDKLQNFMASQGVTTFGSEYCLNGSCEPTNYHEAGHVGMVAAAGLAGTTTHVNEFVNHFYTVTIPTGQYRYYDGLLYFLGLLQTSGNFRIYGGGAAQPPAPTATVTPGGPTATPTNTPAPSTKLHIGVISVSIVQSHSGPQGFVSVTVKDNNGATVSGAAVAGVWSGVTNDSDSGNTNQSGVFSAYSNFGTSGTFTFCVNSITKAGYTYDSAANVATCASKTAP